MKSRFLLPGLLVLVIFISACTAPADINKPMDRSFEASEDEKMDRGRSIFEPTDEDRANADKEGCTGSGPVTFTYSPLDLEYLEFIRPLGAMSSSHITPTDHQYYTPIDTNSAVDAYAVRAPAAGVITSIQHMGSFGDDYNIHLYHTCTFYTIYIHVDKLAPKLAKAAGSFKPGESKRVEVPVEAGEEFGRFGGYSFDFSAHDEDVNLEGYVSPELYKDQAWKVHTVDPYEYFAEPLKSQLQAKSLRTAEPMGGKIDYDVEGRLVGNWFREGSVGYVDLSKGDYWTDHLAIVYDYLDPEHIVISIGDYPGEEKQFGVRGNTPNPADVSASSGVVKYEFLQYDYQLADGAWWDRKTHATGFKAVNGGELEGVVLFEVLENERLRMEVFTGKTAEQVTGFTSAAKMYER